MMESTYLVCVKAGPDVFRVPGSTEHPCADCTSPVWVSKASREAAGPDGTVVCIGCAETRLAKEKDPEFQGLTEGQIREILPYIRTEN